MLFRLMFIMTSIAVMLTFIFCMYSHGEGSIGLAYNQVIDDISYGANANYEHKFGIGELETSSQIQGGDKYLADAHVSFTFDAPPSWPMGLRAYIDVVGKADTLESIESLGGKLDYGLTFNFPVWESSEVGVGVFLRNANPFSTETFYKLEDGKYIEVDPSVGINYDNPADLNILGYTGFEVDRFEIGLKGSLGIGQRDIWLIADATTAFDLDYFDLNLGLNIGNRWYVNNFGEDTNRADIAIMSSISKQW